MCIDGKLGIWYIDEHVYCNCNDVFGKSSEHDKSRDLIVFWQIGSQNWECSSVSKEAGPVVWRKMLFLEDAKDLTNTGNRYYYYYY